MKNILSFGDLKKMVCGTAGLCLPTARQLRDSGSPIAARQKFADGSCLTVYQNGFALFQTTSRATVFRVDACGDYTYFTRTETHIFEEQYFDDKTWYIPLGYLLPCVFPKLCRKTQTTILIGFLPSLATETT